MFHAPNEHRRLWSFVHICAFCLWALCFYYIFDDDYIVHEDFVKNVISVQQGAWRWCGACESISTSNGRALEALYEISETRHRRPCSRAVTVAACELPGSIGPIRAAAG